MESLLVLPSSHRGGSKGEIVASVTVYTARWCADCHRTKLFLKERGIRFREVNIDESSEAEALVLRVNHGRRKVPTLEVDGRFFANSPFDPYRLAAELEISLNA